MLGEMTAMSWNCRTRSIWGVCLTALIAGLASAAHAQVPSITSTSPQAVAPGQSIDVTLRGANLAGATELWTSFSSQTVLSPDVKDNGKNAAQVVYRITVPANATPGVHGIRIATPGGVSALRLFVIDDLPSIAQDRANKTPAAAQVIAVPVAIDGVIDSLSRNYYKFKATAGQQLSFEVLARRLGSPLDPMIRILDMQGRELTYSDDEPGLSFDSRLSHTFQRGGDYLIELRDIRYQGGGTYSYRLRVGDFPCVSVPVPMGAQRGQMVNVNFAGSFVEDLQPLNLQIPSDPMVNWINVAAKRAGGVSSGFALMSVGNGAEFVEREPNDDIKQANRVELGTSLNGRLNQPGDVDHYVFKATKGQKFAFSGITRQQGSPADLLLRLFKADGGKVSEAEDAGTNEGVISYTFPADGDYTLFVEDLHHRGGSPFAYRIDVAHIETGFSLQATADALNVPAGGTALVTVTSARKGYNGPIEIAAVDLPAGFTSIPTVIGAGQNSVVLTVAAAADAASGKLGIVRIVGRAKIGAQDYESVASVETALKARFSAMLWPPRTLTGTVGLGVSPAAQIALKVETQDVVFGKSLTAKLKVTVTRAKGFNEAITLAVTPAKKGLPANVTVGLKPIPKDKNEVEITVTATDKAALGEFTAVLIGTIKQGKVTVVQPLPGLRLKLQAPYQLTADVGEGKLTKGGQLKVKVAVNRNPAFTGPLALTLQNLPKGVTATAATIPADKNEVEVVLSAAADAAVGAVKNITVKGDATVGKAKLSVTSPAIQVTVE
jgi:hypothetical protein